MKKIILFSLTGFLLICQSCTTDNDISAQILLADAIMITEDENLIYPKFDTGINHYALKLDDITYKLLVRAVDNETSIIINNINQGVKEIKFDISNFDYQDTILIQFKKGDITEEYYIHCITNEIPAIKISSVQKDVDNGLLLLNSNFTKENQKFGALFIIDNNGVPVFRRKIEGSITDFKQHPNGYYSYALRKKEKNQFNHNDVEIIVLDENFEEKKRLETVNLTATDNHDFIITNEGTYIMISYDSKFRDFSDYNLSSNELTRDSVIQEVSSTGEVLFEWNSWDHLDILDCLNHRFPDDYAHINSISLDVDGNIIASFRGCSQVLKIDRNNGDVLWSLGGFNPSLKIDGDPFQEFCGQHTASISENGFLTIFDNGGHCNGSREDDHGLFSRALEYKIDTDSSSAFFSSQYLLEGSKNHYTKSGGSFFKTRNGNWLINWSKGVDYGIIEINPNGNEIVLNIELSINEKAITHYRAYKVYDVNIPLKINNEVTFLNISI